MKLKNYYMKAHMTFKNYMIAEYHGVFDCKGHYLHEKEFVQKIYTEKLGCMRYLKPKNIFFLNEKHAPVFDDIYKLINYYDGKNN